MQPTIELTSVSMSYGQKLVLDDVSLTICTGEFVSLIGPSGCGKTTLLRIAADLVKPSSGVVRVNGDSPRAARISRKIGVAFQRPALEPSRTALENVELTLDITGRENGHFPPEAILGDFGLGKFLHHYPHQLSGGMLQRVNIAAAMVHHPPLLLFDEPFGALDEITREQMGEWLTTILRDSGQTVLFVTHSVEEAVLLSDRVVVLSPHPGRVTEVLDIQLPRPRARELRTESIYENEVRRVRKALNHVLSGGPL